MILSYSLCSIFYSGKQLGKADLGYLLKNSVLKDKNDKIIENWLFFYKGPTFPFYTQRGAENI